MTQRPIRLANAVDLGANPRSPGSCAALTVPCASAPNLICVNTARAARDPNGLAKRSVASVSKSSSTGHTMTLKTLALTLASVAALLAGTSPACAADAASAEALAKKSNCMKCHSVSAKKDGPSFKETAAKYKGKADAEQKLVTHLTTNPKIKIDGKEEEHASLKTKDNAEVLNVVQWILSQ